MQKPLSVSGCQKESNRGVGRGWWPAIAIANNKSNKAVERDRKPQLKNGQVGFGHPEREVWIAYMYVCMLVIPHLPPLAVSAN